MELHVDEASAGRRGCGDPRAHRLAGRASSPPRHSSRTPGEARGSPSIQPALGWTKVGRDAGIGRQPRAKPMATLRSSRRSPPPRGGPGRACPVPSCTANGPAVYRRALREGSAPPEQGIAPTAEKRGLVALVSVVVPRRDVPASSRCVDVIRRHGAPPVCEMMAIRCRALLCELRLESLGEAATCASRSQSRVPWFMAGSLSLAPFLSTPPRRMSSMGCAVRRHVPGSRFSRLAPLSASAPESGKGRVASLGRLISRIEKSKFSTCWPRTWSALWRCSAS